MHKIQFSPLELDGSDDTLAAIVLLSAALQVASTGNIFV